MRKQIPAREWALARDREKYLASLAGHEYVLSDRAVHGLYPHITMKEIWRRLHGVTEA